jgi:transcriptional regulator with PAS, ATPase and Fis domain
MGGKSMKILPNKCIELIFEQIGVIAVTDKHGIYVYVNKRWQQDTEISFEEAVGRYSYELIEGSRVMTALRTQKPIIAEILIKTKTGKDLPGIISYIPILDEDEVVGCFISSAFSTMEQAYMFSERIELITKEFESLKGKMRERSGARYKVEDLIGEGPAMRRLKDQIYFAGSSNSTVLIEGETGTGKELVAHSIHNCSLRDIFPFVKVNCSAIPENLMESEFFGYEEGTFTGAKKGGQRGKFENAHLGSIFLDEINNMSLSMQPKLLRVLQEKEIERLGGSESMEVDVRVIAASNVSLKSMVEDNKFRSDLYYRLNIMHIVLPPLRNRKEDIPLLANHMMDKFNDSLGTDIKGISEEALDYLSRYDWPGNVRELQNAVERAMNICRGEELVLKNFRLGETMQNNALPHALPNYMATEEEVESLSEKKEAMEKETILAALEACDNNRSKAARILNISRTSLYKKFKKYNIK